MNLNKRQICDWLAGRADPVTIRAVEEDLRDPDQSATLAWLGKLNATTERWERLVESGAITRWLDDSEDSDLPLPAEHSRKEMATAAPTDQTDINRFVKREVLRLLSKIENPSALLDRKDLRWFRDNVVEAARAANLLATVENTRTLHEALALRLRVVRRENALVTSKSSLVRTSQMDAERTLVLLNAEDQMLADIQADEEFAHVGLWYRLAEDAALLDDEIAMLWDEDPAMVRAALARERAGLRVVLGNDPVL